jgi:hypothetical protein
MVERRKVIGVIGASSRITKQIERVADEVGRLIIENGFSLICGGLGGVMEAACRGAKSVNNKSGGVVIGVILRWSGLSRPFF